MATPDGYTHTGNSYPDTSSHVVGYLNNERGREINWHRDAEGNWHTHKPDEPAHDHFHYDYSPATRGWHGAPEIELLIVGVALGVLALCVGIAIGLTI